MGANFVLAAYAAVVRPVGPVGRGDAGAEGQAQEEGAECIHKKHMPTEAEQCQAVSLPQLTLNRAQRTSMAASLPA